MRKPMVAGWYVLAAALQLLALAVVLRALDAALVTGWVSGTLALAAILLIPVAATRQWRHLPTGMVLAGLLASAVWLPCAVFWGVTYPAIAGTFIVLAMAAVAGAAVATAPRRPRADVPAGERMSPRAREWRDRLVEIGRVQPASVRVKDWGEGDGYDVYGKFQPGGSHWQQLIARKAELEADADLPKDGNMEFCGGETKRDYRIRVTIGTPLDDPIPYPRRLIKPRSIYDAHQHGIYQNGQPITFAHARQNSGAVMAANGGGKSGTMHVWIGTYALCTDCIVIVIDIKGGLGLGEAWVRPWQEARRRGEDVRPPLGALATNGDQAKIVVNYLRDLARARPVWYAEEKAAARSADVPLSPQIPAFRVIIDEPKLLFAERPDIRDDIVELQEVTRAAGIRFDYSLLGGTATYLPLAIQDQVKHQVALEVNDKSDIGHFMDWQAAQAVDLDLLRNRPGMAIVRDTDLTPRLGRYYDMFSGSTIDDIAAKASEIRPDHDARSIELPSWEAYSQLWDCHDPTVTATAPEVPTMTARDDDGLYPDQRPYTPMVSSLDEHRATMADLTAKLNAYEGAPTRTEPTFAEVVAEFKRDPIREAVSQYLAENGESKTGDIIDYLTAPQPDGKGLTQSRQTLTGRLSDMAADGQIDKPRHGYYRL